jgi:1-acyl-sn-glycerol-3-phosphate acyltransferase
MTSMLKQIHRSYTLFIILLFFVILYPFYYASSRKPEWYGILNGFRKLHSYLICLFSGLLLNYRFEEPLCKDQSYIYCANHTSNLDIMIMCILAKGHFHFMGKNELLDNPVLSIFFKSIDIPVNRESKISAFRAFKRAGDNLAKGMSLIIFPEGKIDAAYPPVLQSFKNGPFRLAIDQQIPIVAVSITDAWKHLWDDGSRYGSKPGIAHIYVHKPIYTKDLNIDDSDMLKDRIFDLINSKLVKR